MAGRFDLAAPISNRVRQEERRRAMARGDDRAGEIARCAADPAHFVHEHCVIDDTQGHGDGLGAMPFRLWPDQRTLLHTLRDRDRVIILKARQLGISWLCCAFALWLCLFRPGQLIVLLSKDEDAAKELLRRIKIMYLRLPEWLKVACPRDRKSPDSTTVFGWANGSIIKSFAATKGAGRSFTASLVIMDEAAWMTWAKQVYTAASPTMEAGGRIIALSTANGAAGWFYDFWRKAESKLNDFAAVFLPWWSRPGRDSSWYQRRLAESTDPASVKQEYPATALEAFIASGRVRFPHEWLGKQARHAVPEITRLPEALAPLEGVRVWESYDPLRRYAVSADVAEGGVGGDFCAGLVLDLDTGSEAASIHGRWEPDEFGRRLAILGGAYGYSACPIIVERNNHGHAVLLALRNRDYPAIAVGEDGRLGWVTSPKSKPQMIDAVAARLRDDRLKLRTPALLAELRVFRVQDGGTCSAPEGEHDDFVMALGVFCGWRDVLGAGGI